MSTQAQFENWWKSEGSRMPRRQGEDTEEYIRRICEITWSNGAYLAGLDVAELVRELVKLPRLDFDIDHMMPHPLGDFVRFDNLVAALKRFEAKLEAPTTAPVTGDAAPVLDAIDRAIPLLRHHAVGGVREASDILKAAQLKARVGK